MSTNPEEIWLTERQVAQRLSLSLKKLQADRFSRTGIVYSKVGRSVRYALSDVLSYMESVKVVHG